MGSSTKKKHEKKRDFKKPKLKVGKVRPKPTNLTDTSFKSRSIVLAQQSLSTNAPSTSSQFSRHLSLLSSRSSSQRRDSLAYLTTVISSRKDDTPLLQPVSVLLPRLCPLILDESNGVRAQLSRLLHELPSQDVEPHIAQLLLYIRAGLTHLAADVRSSAIDLLLWAVETCSDEVVSCAGGWIKTLKCLITILHWQALIDSGSAPAVGQGQGQGSWTSSRASTLGTTTLEGKVRVKTLSVFATFLRTGFVKASEQGETCLGNWPFPLGHVDCHMTPKYTNAYAHLNLFGKPRDEDADMYAERDGRQRVFHHRFRTAVESGVQAAKQEGGEIGRAASGLEKALVEGMEDFGPDE